MDLENIILNEISQSEKDNYLRFRSSVESNEQTELTSKTEPDAQIESRMTALAGSRAVEVGGGETEQKGKRTLGHGQQCGDCLGEGSIMGREV